MYFDGVRLRFGFERQRVQQINANSTLHEQHIELPPVCRNRVLAL
jgi:hypothetical protein